MDRTQIAEHLRFYGELGVTGISRDASWRARQRSGGATEAAVGGQENTEGGVIEDAALQSSPSGNASSRVQAPEGASQELMQIARSAQEVLAAIRGDLGECSRCKLHLQGRTQIVFGVGNPSAEVMFVGEAPGADEDIQGEPFVGRAGQLLTKMIEAMGFRRDEVYIANVLKCRPPGNRNPEPDEIAQCEPFLFRQIASIQPKVIIALGAFAARTLLKTQDPISRLRGRVYDYRGAQLIPTFHPSFLLRSPGYKREAWDDLKKALALLDRQPPPSSPSAGR